MKKISEWLDKIDPWGIYFSTKMKEDFHKETGQEPDWPEHSYKETVKIMEDRGLGGSICSPTSEKMCYGYEMAVALAEKYVPEYSYTKIGRGSAFAEAQEALKEEGM